MIPVDEGRSSVGTIPPYNGAAYEIRPECGENKPLTSSRGRSGTYAGEERGWVNALGEQAGSPFNADGSQKAADRCQYKG